MSDGPHRSLNMPRGWKKVAQIADNPNHSVEDVCDRVGQALITDWHYEVTVFEGVKEVLRQGSKSEQLEQLGALRDQAAINPMDHTFLECAEEAVRAGFSGTKALEKAVEDTAIDRAGSSKRQVREHYLRKSSKPRSDHVHTRMEKAINHPSTVKAAVNSLLGLGDSKPLQSQKRTGLEEGVPL